MQRHVFCGSRTSKRFSAFEQTPLQNGESPCDRPVNTWQYFVIRLAIQALALKVLLPETAPRLLPSLSPSCEATSAVVIVTPLEKPLTKSQVDAESGVSFVLSVSTPAACWHYAMPTASAQALWLSLQCKHHNRYSRKPFLDLWRIINWKPSSSEIHRWIYISDRLIQHNTLTL